MFLLLSFQHSLQPTWVARGSDPFPLCFACFCFWSWQSQILTTRLWVSYQMSECITLHFLSRDNFQQTLKLSHCNDSSTVPLNCAISLTLDLLSCCHHLLIVSLQCVKMLSPARGQSGGKRPPQGWLPLHCVARMLLLSMSPQRSGRVWQVHRQGKRRKLMAVFLHYFLRYLKLPFSLNTC